MPVTFWAGSGAAATNNLAGTTAPTVTDDESLGYSVGSLWFDSATGVLYTCSDATIGAAVWAVSAEPEIATYYTGDSGDDVAVDYDYNAVLATVFPT